MTDLFNYANQARIREAAPLAERLRPHRWEDFVGQSHLVGPGKFLTESLKSGALPSLIFWGPPGSGKTTLALLIATSIQAEFVALSAVTSGIKDVKAVICEAENRLRDNGKRTLLFIDEIHRFNKAQQDAFLPHVEKGTIVLIGATTENPSFEVISALLSRCRVLTLKMLSREDLEIIIGRALTKKNTLPLPPPLEGGGKHTISPPLVGGDKGEGEISVENDALTLLCEKADGDARRALNILENLLSLIHGQGKTVITIEHLKTVLQQQTFLYDKSGEEHYNLISAFIKSMRGSDPDAAVYYLARMLEAGEDPLFLARRMVILASEDIGNADPQAIQVAIAAMQAFDFVGMPEGFIPLAQAATYLASAPKSNASYMAYKKAKADIEATGTLPVPLYLRNAPTQLMKQLDYGKGYQYAHDYAGNIVNQQHLPDAIKDRRYYDPTDNGYETTIRNYLAKVHRQKIC